jgi:hypothetical protein
MRLRWAIRLSVVAFVGLGALPAAAENGKGCATLKASPSLSGLFCAETRAGVVLASRDVAASLLPSIDAAAAGFERHFGTPPQPIAVVVTDRIEPVQSAALRTLGYASLPWPDPMELRAKVDAAIRAQVSGRLAGQPQAVIDAAVQQGLAQLPPAPKDGQAPDAVQEGALSHEIGHQWFAALFDGVGREKSATPRYGSSAPDWLDEAGAVLAENDAITATRWALLATDPAMIPMADYTTMVHPLFNAARAGAGDMATGSGVRVVTGAAAEAMINSSPTAKRAPKFYAQTRAFADFLIAKTGNPRVMAELAGVYRKGGDLKGWLAATGRASGLPADLATLGAQFTAWVSDRIHTQR